MVAQRRMDGRVASPLPASCLGGRARAPLPPSRKIFAGFTCVSEIARALGFAGAMADTDQIQAALASYHRASARLVRKLDEEPHSEATQKLLDRTTQLRAELRSLLQQTISMARLL